MVYEHRVQETLRKFGGDRKRAAAELKQHADWYNDPGRQSEVLRGYEPIAQRSVNPWAELIWTGYRRLNGDRAMIILPMGGAIPGQIPYTAAARWFDDNEWDIQDREEVQRIWDELDNMTAQHEAESAHETPPDEPEVVNGG